MDPFLAMEQQAARTPVLAPRSSQERRRALARAETRAAETEPQRAARVAEMRRRRSRGRNGETEVVKLWRSHGWPDAMRQPGSGALRPWGARDTTPFPLDVQSGWPQGWPRDGRIPQHGPWTCEVKFSAHAERARASTWTGEAFVRQTLRSVTQTWQRQLDILGQGGPCFASLFVRGARAPWQVFVPDACLRVALGGEFTSPARAGTEWVGLSVEDFFAWVARSVLE